MWGGCIGGGSVCVERWVGGGGWGEGEVGGEGAGWVFSKGELVHPECAFMWFM